MKICHNCGRELENTIKNCIRCNVEQFDDAVIFKAQPKPPPEVKSRKTTNVQTEEPTKNTAPPYVQQEAVPPAPQQTETVPTNDEVIDNSGLVSPFDSGSTPPITEITPNEPNTTEIIQNDKVVDEMLDEIISEEVSREDEKHKDSSNKSLLLLLVLIFVIVIVIVQPYIENAIAPSKPTYSNVTSVAPVVDTADIVTQIVENDGDDVTVALEGDISEQFLEFDYINKTIHELNEFYNNESSELEDSDSSHDIIGKNYLVQITTDTDYIITNINYTKNYDANAETLNESISLINQISDFFAQNANATPIPVLGLPTQILTELTFENLTQEGFVGETFKSSYLIDNSNIVIITVECSLVDGVYTLINSIDFEESNLGLDEILTDDNVTGDVLEESDKIIVLHDGTESPYTQVPSVTLTST